MAIFHKNKREKERKKKEERRKKEKREEKRRDHHRSNLLNICPALKPRKQFARKQRKKEKESKRKKRGKEKESEEEQIVQGRRSFDSLLGILQVKVLDY